jgi:glycosyltransferase involved in cell wall biosynthesis
VSNRNAKPARLAVLADLVEENWPSMELAAEMIPAALEEAAPGRLTADILRPAMRRRFTREPADNGRKFNADRLLNRFWDYPRWLRGQRKEYDLFHLADHSYAQMAHELPAERLVITCHDVDTFRCLWGEDGARNIVYRRLVERTLAGLRRAARVICVSQVTADELTARGLVKAEKTRVAHNPAHPWFAAAPGEKAQTQAAQLLGGEGPLLLHVGSNIQRKRLDVLLRVLAATRRIWPQVRLARVGGELTPEQKDLARQLGVAEAIISLPPLEREVLAAVYRRAAVTVLPSEREGFGWPVAESLAAGSPVIASDLPVLREVGGDAAEYAPLGDVAGWAQKINFLLAEKELRPAERQNRCEAARRQAAKFSLVEYGRRLLAIYEEIAEL